MATNEMSAPHMAPWTNALMQHPDDSGQPSERKTKPAEPGCTSRYASTISDHEEDVDDVDKLERRVIELQRQLKAARLLHARALASRAPMRKVIDRRVSPDEWVRLAKDITREGANAGRD